MCVFFFRCLHYFSSSAKLEVHNEDCEKLNDCAIRLSNEDDKKECIPFVVYADLECALEKLDRNPESVMYRYQHHNMFSFEYVHCSYDNIIVCFRDKDCIA
ncbi:hypothetical protein ALC53_08037 [Atta colombica]|uniref:Uncharacterized protein n=1 Tax=Atta colombica TaxID=520822 RepID=A0A195BBR5_9HYME|nr:hypothetical protein ALC53_08037 [Atta colombica]